MKTDKHLGSSLTFNIRTSRQIQEVLQLIKSEARKEDCSESEVTLISTAVSEVCRRFMDHSESLHLTLSIISRSWGIELQGKASTRGNSTESHWERAMISLNAYFSKTSLQKDDDSDLISYSFQKEISFD